MNIIIDNMNTINEAHLYIVLHSYDWHMQIAYTFVQYFTFLTLPTVNFCATTAKFHTDIHMQHCTLPYSAALRITLIDKKTHALFNYVVTKVTYYSVF